MPKNPIYQKGDRVRYIDKDESKSRFWTPKNGATGTIDFMVRCRSSSPPETPFDELNINYMVKFDKELHPRLIPEKNLIRLLKLNTIKLMRRYREADVVSVGDDKIPF